jgi:hypothetical protein
VAAPQRPAALATLGQPSGPPAWQSIPSWYMVAGRDNAIGTAAEQIMAKRMGAPHRRDQDRLARGHGVPPRRRHEAHPGTMPVLWVSVG